MFGTLHLTRFFFLIQAVVVCIIGAAFLFPWLMIVGKTLLIVSVLATIVDVMLIYLPKEPITVQRRLQERMNLGVSNAV